MNTFCELPAQRLTIFEHEHCRCHHNHDAGIALLDSAAALVEHNDISHNKHDGIGLQVPFWGTCMHV